MLIRVPEIDYVVFSSDSSEYCSIAQKYADMNPGRIRVVRKDPKDASSQTTAAEYFQYIAGHLDADVGAVVYAPVTAPMLEPTDFSNLVQAFLNSDPAHYDSVGFVLERRGHFWYANQPLNYDPSDQRGTQNALPVVEVPYTAHIVDRRAMRESRSVLGRHVNSTRPPLFIPLSILKNVDIDYPEEFELAQILYTHQHGPPSAGGAQPQFAGTSLGSLLTRAYSRHDSDDGEPGDRLTRATTV
eukprot:COSAG06_NODE_4075_length_4599_cov_98.407333_2_plen_243_part_00